jgi:hypothetical protein
MVLSTIFLEDKHKILFHLSIFYEYQQFFQHRICFSIQPPDYSDPWPRLARSTSFFIIMLFNNLWALCTIHVYLVIYVFVVCLYMYCRWRTGYQEGRAGISLTGLNRHIFVFDQDRTWLFNVICRGFVLWSIRVEYEDYCCKLNFLSLPKTTSICHYW